MANDVSQYYITQAPEITEISVTPNPVSAGASVVIAMKITQSPKYLYPETYYPTEIYSGEVSS